MTENNNIEDLELDFTEETPAPEKKSKESKKQESKRIEKPIGTILKEERNRQGMSLDAVHEATKIPLDALRAIEEGYEVRTLSPFYIKGFIKIYGQYIGVDTSDYTNDYRNERLAKYHKTKEEPSFDMGQWFSSALTPQRKKILIALAIILLGLFFLFKTLTFVIGIIGQGIKERRNKAQVESVKENVERTIENKEAEKKQEKKETKPPAPAVVQPAVLPETPSNTEKPSVVPAKNVTLTVRARKESWLRVSADGAIVFQSTLALGSVETWIADDTIEITGRNLNELEFELNGSMIGTLGRKDRNAKKLIVTKDGLSVTQ